MGEVITNLKARFGVDTSDFRKGLKDGEKAVNDFKDTASDTLDQFASMFGVNMSAVNDAIGTASKSLNFLGSAFNGTAKGGEALAIAMKVLKVAMISTGIGAIVVALGSLMAYFQKSGEGADRFAKILSQVKSVINNVVERIVAFGGGLADIFSGKFTQGWEKMRDAFKGFGTEVKEDWKAAGALADAEDALEDRGIALINSLEERRAKVAELRLQAKEETEDQNKKLSLLKQAESVIRSVYGDQVSLEKERLRIMNERLAISAKDPTDDQRREVAEQEAKINSLLRQQAEELRSITREKGAVLKIVNAELALEKAKSEQIGITKVSIENIKIPDLGKDIGGSLIVSFTKIQEALGAFASSNLFGDIALNAFLPFLKMQESINEVMVDVTKSVNDAFENMAIGIGEFIGSLALGDANFADFGKMVIGVFADLAINVGKIAIGAGFAVAGVKKALLTLNPAVAIAAGIALIAIGTAVKGALSAAASGGGSSGSSAAITGGSYTYDTGVIKTEPIEIHLKGEFIQSGPNLVAVVDQEYKRKYKNT
jgi:hypothetical protein